MMRRRARRQKERLTGRPLLLFFMTTLRFFDISKIFKYYFKILLSKNYSVKKILITGDDVDYSTSTVYHYKLKDFLMMDEL